MAPAETPLPVRHLQAWNASAVVAVRQDRGELTVELTPESLSAAARLLKDERELAYDMLADLTAVDWYPADPRIELVYQLLSTKTLEWLRLKTRLNPDRPIASVTSIWPNANWYEREIFDLFGVGFAGHPDLRRIMLPDDWQGHPLRKDYPVEGYR